MARGKPPVYDRAALKLTAEEKQELEAQGRKAALALPARTPAHAIGTTSFAGPQEIDAASISDPVLIREDGTPLYTFTSVVDDADVGITHIIRGEDHVTNTAVQIQLFEALGAAVPASRTTICSSARRARRCPSGSARCRSPACARKALSRWR